MNSILFTTYVDDFVALIKDSITQTVKDSIREEIQNFINSPKSQQDELLTIQEAAKFLRVSKPTIYKRIKNKSLRPYTFGGRRIYFKKQELIDSMKSITIKNKSL